MNAKIVVSALLALSFAASIGCNRPQREVEKPEVLPIQISNDELETDADEPVSEIISEEMKPFYEKDLTELEKDQKVIEVVITNKKKLRKILSNSWKTDHRASNGEVVFGSGNTLAADQNYCHFVDKSDDFKASRRGSIYEAAQIEVKAREESTRYVLHLKTKSTQGTQFIVCRAKLGSSFTAMDLKKTFGDHLGLYIYIK